MISLCDIKFWMAVVQKERVARWMEKIMSDTSWSQREQRLSNIKSAYASAFHEAIMMNDMSWPWDMANRLRPYTYARTDVLYLGVHQSFYDAKLIREIVIKTLYEYMNLEANSSQAEVFLEKARIPLYIASKRLMSSRITNGGDLGVLADLPANAREKVLKFLQQH